MSTEREKLPVTQRETEPSVPREVKKQGVTPRKESFTAKVEKRGKSLVQPSQAQSVTITLPDDEDSLQKKSKGNITQAITWFAHYWLRMIKKAQHFGHKIVRKK